MTVGKKRRVRPDARPGARARPARHARATLAASILGSSLAFVDGSVVNVALPAIQRGFSAPDALISLAINAYLLPLGALILLGGAAGDRYGRRRLFLLGLAVFTAATILCAAAPTFALLLAGRTLQGVGSALLMPNSLAILGATFEGEKRGQAVGTWAAVGAIAGAIGPLLGGWIVDAIGWRSIFLLNVPIAAGAAFLAWRYVAESKSDDGEALDWLGAALATLGLLAVTWALTAAADAKADHAGTALWALGGVAALVAFVVVEARRGERALMPLALFANASFVGLTLLTFFLYGALGGLIVLLPYELIRVAGYSAIAAGAAMLPMSVVIGVGSRLMGRVAARYGGRWPLAIGATIVSAGFALYARIGQSIDFWRDVLPPTLLVAIGMGIAVAPLTTSVIGSVDSRHVGTASGFNSAVARIAGLIATALLGFVLARQESVPAFVASARVAAWIGAASALVAAVSAMALVSTPAKKKPAR